MSDAPKKPFEMPYPFPKEDGFHFTATGPDAAQQAIERLVAEVVALWGSNMVLYTGLLGLMTALDRALHGTAPNTAGPTCATMREELEKAIAAIGPHFALRTARDMCGRVPFTPRVV